MDNISVIVLYSLQALVRGGITVSAVFNYQLNPELSTTFCYQNYQIRVKNCATIYHQWANNRIALDVWYQLRSIKMCDGRILDYVSSQFTWIQYTWI